MFNCAVIGGSGFIGSHLVEYLLQHRKYERIYILDLLKPRVTDERVIFCPCDIRKPIQIKAENCKTIYHLAALAKEPGYEWGEYFDTNHIGSKNVCDFAEINQIDRIIHTSTMMVFQAGEQRMSELSPTYPDTAYGISKLLGEEVHKTWQAKKTSRFLKIVRPAVVFGKYEGGNYTRLYNALKKGTFAYIGRKETVKSSIYVKDLVRFLVFCDEQEPEPMIYNMAFPEVLTIERICNALAEVMKLKPPQIVIPFNLALMLGYMFTFLNKSGILKTGIHHRRIEKLFFSTNIAPQACLAVGFEFAFTLPSALEDWRKECGGEDLY